MVENAILKETVLDNDPIQLITIYVILGNLVYLCESPFYNKSKNINNYLLRVYSVPILYYDLVMLYHFILKTWTSEVGPTSLFPFLQRFNCKIKELRIYFNLNIWQTLV